MEYKFRYRVFAEALYDALLEDAFYITMEESVVNGSSREAMLRYLDYSIIEAEQYGEVVIPESHNYGISIWTKPLEQEAETLKNNEKKNFLKTYMGKASLETYNSIVSFMAQKASSAIPENAWYLSIIGILPHFQGNGHGVGLIDEILRKTDQQQIPTYLETFTPRNMPFYQRLGYEVAQGVREPTTGADYWIMLRTPSQT